MTYLVYAGNGDAYGHVGIFESTNVTYHQNSGGSVFKSTTTYNKIVGSQGAPYWGCIHPNFKAETTNVTVTFNANGGTVLGNSSVSVTKGSSVGDRLPSARKANYVFEGWYKADGTTKISGTTAINSSITVYAKWSQSKLGAIESGRVYRIINNNSKKALQAESASNKALIKQRTVNDSYSQLWEANVDGNYYTFENINGGRRMDMTGGYYASRTGMQIFDFSESDNQKFSVVNRGGFYSIHSKSTGRALDIANTSKDDGAQLQSYYYHGGGEQQFSFVEYTDRKIYYFDNLSKNYFCSLENDNAVNAFKTRASSYVTVSINKLKRTMTINALKAGSSSNSMTFQSSVSGSHKYDFYDSDCSTKYIAFRARSNVSGAKINFRWGYDSSTPIATATLSTNWQTFCLALPRSTYSGSNIHPWVDRACTIEMDNVLLLDENSSGYSIHFDGSHQSIIYDINDNDMFNTLPTPINQKDGCHFMGWYTRRSGGSKISPYINMLDRNAKYYAQWEEHKFVFDKIIPASCTSDGYTLEKCSCGAEKRTNTVKANGHTFYPNSSVCTVCGVANPNYKAPTTTAPKEVIITTEPIVAPTVRTTHTTTQHAQTTTAPAQTTTTQPATTVNKQKSTSISKLTKGKKQFKVIWKKVSSISGYQIQYSTDKKFKKNVKTVTAKKSSTSATIKKLKSVKTYYVRVRTYKTTKVNGKATKIYSSWSKVKSVKTK